MNDLAKKNTWQDLLNVRKFKNSKNTCFLHLMTMGMFLVFGDDGYVSCT